MVEILHTADWHSRAEDLDEIKACGDTILKTALERKPDLVVIAGDVFHSRDAKAESEHVKYSIGLVRDLSGICPVVGVIGTPSHDGKAPLLLNSVGSNHEVFIAERPVQVILRNDQLLPLTPDRIPDTPATLPPAAIITLIPAPTKEFFKSDAGISEGDQEIGQALTTMFAGYGATAANYQAPHILVGHWNVTGAFVSGTERLTGVDIEVSVDQMAMAQANVVCLGHIHLGQKIGENIFFSGSPQMNSWGEIADKGLFYHTIDWGDTVFRHDGERGQLTSEFITTPTTKRIRFDADLTDTTKEVPMTSYQGGDYKDALIRLDFKVFTDEVSIIDQDAIRKFFEGEGAKQVDINIARIPRINARSSRLLEIDALREKVQEHAKIKDEAVSESILAKADRLDNEHPDTIINSLKGGEYEARTDIQKTEGYGQAQAV